MIVLIADLFSFKQKSEYDNPIKLVYSETMVVLEADLLSLAIVRVRKET